MENNSQDTENTQNIENNDLHSSSPKTQQQPADSETLLNNDPTILDPEVSEDNKNQSDPEQPNDIEKEPENIPFDERPIRPSTSKEAFGFDEIQNQQPEPKDQHAEIPKEDDNKQSVSHENKDEESNLVEPEEEKEEAVIETPTTPKHLEEEKINQEELKSEQKPFEEQTITPKPAAVKKPIKKTAPAKTKFDKFASVEDREIDPTIQKEFDEKPVGTGGGGFQISEYPEGMNPFPEEQAESAPQDTGPLSSRVKSKVWKVRQSAFEELVQKFNESDPNDEIFEEYSSDLEKFIADANPGAQEKALEALKAYLTKKERVTIDGHSVTKTLIDKALGPAKPNIKVVSYDTLCLMFEKMDKQGIFDGVVESINHKNQKTSCAGVQATVELLKNYGPKRLDFLKPFFSHIEKLAGSTVSSLRTEAMNFYKEAYRFMGDGMKPFTTKLKKAQVDELEKFYAESPKEIAKPLREEVVKIPIKEGGKAKAVEVAEGFDAYDIADPVDIFKKFNDKWASKVLAMEKWNEKKNALEEFLKEAENTPKIATVPIQHITSTLKKLLNDNNFPIVFTTVKIYGALAKGLRRHLHSQCKLIMPFLLEKLKDKRSALIEETTKTLDNFLYCINPDDVLEDLKEGISNKSPNMRITLLSWIDRYFERNAKNTDKLVNLFKNLLPVLKKLVDDSSNDVREAAIKSLAKQKVILGDEVIKDSFNDLNPARLSKLNAIVSGITGIPLSEADDSVTTTTKADSVAGSPRRPGIKGGASFDIDDRSPKGGLSSAEKTQKSGQKVINVKPSSVKKIDPADGKRSAASKDTSKMHTQADIEAFESTLGLEDIEGRLLELSFPESLIKGLSENGWKEKQKAIGEYSQWIAENAGAVAELAEFLYQELKFKMKDWKESNPNVVKEALQLIQNTASNPEIHQTKKSFSVVLPFLLANIQEAKYSQFCQNIFQAFVESIHPRFIILAIITSTQETKTSKTNPKVIIEICNLFTKLMDSLTLSLFPLKETIEFGKIALGATLPANRTAGINLFKAMYQQLGAPLNDFLTDVNPAVLKTLTAEFAKIQPDKDLQCRVQFRGEAEKETKIELSKNLDPLASLPRVDISKDVEKMMKKLNDNDWKVKQEGLDALDSLLAANGNRISPNGLHNLVMTLKHRLNDHNKNQVKNFVIFVGKLIYALGSEGKPHAKILLPEIVKNLSDKQTLIRAETVKTCDKFADAIGAEIVINSLLPLLTHESPELRQEVINWVLKNHESLARSDVKGNVAPLLAVLQDKTKDIRTLAERLMEKCVAVIGIEPYQAILKDMKPAIQDFLKPVFKKLKGEDETPVPDVDSPNVSFEKKVELVSNRTLKKNPSEATLAQQQQQQAQAPGKQSVGKGKAPGKLVSSNSLKTDAEETKESLRKTGALDKSVHTMNNLSGGSLNNSMTSNTDSQAYVKSITSTGEKVKRQEEDRKTRWPTEELREDLVAKLKDHFKKNVSKDLFTKMFAVDTKKNVEAVRILSKALIVEFQETVDILDMVLRWFFSRLWDNVNTQMMKESLDYFFSLSMSLEAAKYTLLDFEANVLIPCLVNRLGTGPSNLKISLHKIFPKLGGICAPQRIAGFLVNALNSRSHKTKIESIEVLAEMVKVYGPEIITPKDLKVYAKLLGDTDVNIKGNALKLMSEVGNYMGEELLNITGKDIPPKLQEVIQQQSKQKRVATQESDTEESESAGLNKTSNRIELEPEFDQIKEVEEEQGLFMSQYKTRKPRGSPTNLLARADERLMEIPKAEDSDLSESYQRDMTEDHVIEEYSEDTGKIQEYSQLAVEEEEEEDEEIMEEEEQIKNELSNVVLLGERVEEGLFEKCLELLRRGSIAGKLDALLFIQDVISSENQENKEFLETNAGTLLSCLQIVLSNLLSKPSSKVPIKFLLYFLDLVHKLVTIKSFLKGVSEENLQDVFETLIQKVLVQTDQSRFESKDNVSIIKIMNSIILRLLENSDPNRSIIALFALASKYRKSQEDDRVLGLVLKCILKLANALRTLVSAVKPEKILLELHLFLLDYEDDHIYVQPNIPIKAVKIILQQLVNLFGQRILQFYSQSVQSHPSQDKHLKSWISALLQAKSDKKWTPTSGGVEHIEEEDENGPNNEEMEKAEEKVKELMNNITQTTNFKKVLEELYDELHKHKYISIRPYMEGKTDSFKLYVANALQKIHFERTTLVVDENFVDKSKNIYHIKPIKKEEKENQEEETETEVLQNRWNTLQIRFALITKNGNTEFSKICEKKPELELEPEKPAKKEKQPAEEKAGAKLNIEEISEKVEEVKKEGGEATPANTLKSDVDEESLENQEVQKTNEVETKKIEEEKEKAPENIVIVTENESKEVKEEEKPVAAAETVKQEEEEKETESQEEKIEAKEENTEEKIENAENEVKEEKVEDLKEEPKVEQKEEKNETSEAVETVEEAHDIPAQVEAEHEEKKQEETVEDQKVHEEHEAEEVHEQEHEEIHQEEEQQGEALETIEEKPAAEESGMKEEDAHHKASQEEEVVPEKEEEKEGTEKADLKEEAVHKTSQEEEVVPEKEEEKEGTEKADLKEEEVVRKISQEEEVVPEKESEKEDEGKAAEEPGVKEEEASQTVPEGEVTEENEPDNKEEEAEEPETKEEEAPAENVEEDGVQEEEEKEGVEEPEVNEEEATVEEGEAVEEEEKEKEEEESEDSVDIL